MPVLETYFHPALIGLNTNITKALLALFGENPVIINANTVQTDKFGLKIILDCCALEPMAIFLAFVIAFPSSFRKKLKGIAWAIILIFTLNIIRIVSLYYSGAYIGAKFMEFMHLDIWQVALILFSLILSLLWIKWQPQTKT